MKTYRMNAVMAGTLYFLGTVFGVLGGCWRRSVIPRLFPANRLLVWHTPGLVAANSSQITGGAFFTLMMGISLVAMTVFLYPIFRKDSEELAGGLLLFRGALEGTGNMFSTLGFLALVALSNEYVATGANSAAYAVGGQFLISIPGPHKPRSNLTLYLSFYWFRRVLLSHPTDSRRLSVWGHILLVR